MAGRYQAAQQNDIRIKTDEDNGARLLIHQLD